MGKKGENNNIIEIDNLIALTNILNYYEEFNKELKIFIKKEKYNRDLISKLDKISKGEFCLRDMGAKAFYNNNRYVINTINKYSSIYDFICSNYDYHGNPINNYNKLDYYYNYLLKNKDNIEQIKKLLDKIKELGFNTLDLNESYDFRKTHYNFFMDYDYDKTHNKKRYYSSLNYLENIKVLPNYDENIIDYCTTDSNYRIIMNDFDKETGLASSNIIMVNSLTFDANKLPKKLSKEETLDKVLKMKNNNVNEDKLVKEHVQLSVAIDDLEKKYIITNEVINKLDSVTNKEELKKALIEIIDNIVKLRELEKAYNKSIIDNNNKISDELLYKEKRLYLEKRYWQYLDLD